MTTRTRLITGTAIALLLALAIFAPAGAQGDPDRYLVKFREPGFGKAALRAAGATVLLDLGAHQAAAARIPAQAVQGLRNNPHIEYLEADPPRYPMAQVVPFGIPMVEADQVTDGLVSNRKLCIIDSGYFAGHEDLQDANVTYTVNAGTGDPWIDGCGHGTHVAGTIAALDNASGVIGVTRNGALDLHIVKVFGNDCAWTYTSNLIDALDRCRAAGANVVSMSLGCSGRTCSSRTEKAAFDAAYAAGVLSIAAAGNDGSTSMSYPASYDSVVSVAAIDASKVVADFSQKNSQVEVAAPGVAVLSTVPWLEANTLTSGTTWNGGRIEGAARTSGKSGVLVDGGQCTAANGDWAGKVVLCQRGTVSFFDKVENVRASGGVAAAIYNNVANDPTCGVFLGTLGDGVTSTLPAIALSCADGTAALARAGSSGTLVSSFTTNASGYEAWDGTSMATPHVAGVAALVWSHVPAKSNVEIRQALRDTAEDLGAAGKDNAYGYGLVRAKAALDLLTGSGGGGSCTPTEPNETFCSDGIDNDCDTLIDLADPDCSTGSCQPPGTSCTTNDQCCSLSCKGKPGAKTCK